MPDDEFESGTGKSQSQWFAVLEASGILKFGELIKWLQAEHGLEYRPAHELTLRYLRHREQNAPEVRYTSSGRSGTVHYVSKEASFDMWYEFAGGDALAIIKIPTPAEWETETKMALSRRQDVLTFIGQQVVKDQTHNGSFTIEDDYITIYSFKSDHNPLAKDLHSI